MLLLEQELLLKQELLYPAEASAYYSAGAPASAEAAKGRFGRTLGLPSSAVKQIERRCSEGMSNLVDCFLLLCGYAIPSLVFTASSITVKRSSSSPVLAGGCILFFFG